MTALEKLKHEIFLLATDGCEDYGDGEAPTGYGDVDGEIRREIESEIREGDVVTDIPAPYSRHYEAKSVARKLQDGSWVGWTYWYGGGKHGNPEEIEWMDGVYDLDVTEVEKMVVVREFKKKE